MGILGISNRTENWKTATAFAPFFNDKVLLRKLVFDHLNPCDDSSKDHLEIELFWEGLRDLRFKYKNTEKEINFEERLIRYYRDEFRDLRTKLKAYKGLRISNKWNYDVSKENHRKKFLSNVLSTEIDIVIQSKNYLYLGEAKSESKFGSDGRDVLVHQLIRQYVVGTLLLKERYPGMKITQFAVVNKETLERRRQKQANFVISQGWMKDSNILTWDQVASIATGS